MAAFGTGDTLSAWMVSFMVETRHSPAAASRYQLAGYWAAIALGRVVVGLTCSGLPEKTFNLALLGMTSACLAVVWALHQYIADAVLLCIAGLFLGPVTPRVLSAISDRVPPSLKSSAMSLVIGNGLIATGAGPLIFGFVAGRGWLGSLPAVLVRPILAQEALSDQGAAQIVMCGIGCAGWIALPKNDRRDE